MWAGFAAYLAILVLAPALGRRVVAAAIVLAVAGFAVAPVLLSHDVYSYVDYAPLGVVHGLDPHVPAPPPPPPPTPGSAPPPVSPPTPPRRSPHPVTLSSPTSPGPKRPAPTARSSPSRPTRSPGCRWESRLPC